MIWLKANWMWLLPLVLALLQVANKATVHFRELAGPWYARLLPTLLLFFTEMVSVLPSRGVPGLKLPLTSKPPGTVATKPPKITLLLVLLLPPLSGCAGWKDATIRTLWVVHEVGVAGRQLAENDMCAKAVAACRAKGLKSDVCPDLQKGQGCDGDRRKVIAAAKTIQASVSLGAKMVRVADKTTAAKILASVMGAAKNICDAIKAWTAPPDACGFLP